MDERAFLDIARWVFDAFPTKRFVMALQFIIKDADGEIAV